MKVQDSGLKVMLHNRDDEGLEWMSNKRCKALRSKHCTGSRRSCTVEVVIDIVGVVAIISGVVVGNIAHQISICAVDIDAGAQAAATSTAAINTAGFEKVDLETQLPTSS